MKKQVIVLALMTFMLIASAASVVTAQSTIHFIPVGGTPTGTAPILTGNPADCILSEQATGVTANNMWAVIIVDQATYDARSTATVTFAQKDHNPSAIPTATLSKLTEATASFPSQTAIFSASWIESGSWPGCNQQYNPNAMQAALGSDKVYYMVVDISAVLDNGQLVNGANQEIIITVNGVTNFKVAVFLMAHDASSTSSVLNLRTPQTDSPLITTPELTTLVMIPIGLGAAGLYIKRKQTPKITV